MHKFYASAKDQRSAVHSYYLVFTDSWLLAYYVLIFIRVGKSDKSISDSTGKGATRFKNWWRLFY